jgi:threonine/homoserine/homoserine lactone efflux protein
MTELPGLILFAVVSSGTPGPNNLLLWASGVQFGFRATVPQIIGTSAGIGALALAVAAGLGIVVTRVPGVELALKILGSAYLLFLAFQLAGGGAIQRGKIERPLRFHEAAAFQFLNPKGWLFALAAVSTFRPVDLPVVVGSAIVILVMIVIVIPTAAIWAAGGTALHRLAADQRSNRALNGALGLLLATSIAFIWI